MMGTCGRCGQQLPANVGPINVDRVYRAPSKVYCSSCGQEIPDALLMDYNRGGPSAGP
jgi:hypothetical protein